MVNSPIPTDLAGECKKAAKTLNNFIDPVAAKGPDKVIPSNILQKAKGFAIFTVIKAGFLFSGRLGSGLVVARLEDGSWSAPSAINIVGMGAGGQIGAELTDFVMVLNSKDAVKSFMHGGNVTLGGNLSVAAGPIGRTAEGAGSVSLGNVAAIFSYSKTKGLFAGVSIEGSVIAERRDANSKFYHSRVTAKELLLGKIPPPPQADILYRALNAKASRTNYGDTQYNEEPVYGEEYDAPKSPKSSRSVSLSTSSSSRSNTHKNRSSSLSSYKNKNNDNKDHSDEDEDSYSKVVSSIKKKPNYYESATKASSLASSNEINDEISKRISSGSSLNRKSLSKPPPIAPKPNIPPRKKQQTAVALYDFDGEQEGDLSFRKGDIIVITKHSESTNDWWTGRCSGKEGIFPANYVELN